MSTSKCLRLFMLVFLFGASLAATAARVDGLYEAEVPVADDGTEARNDGLRLALQQVLIKLSGRAGVNAQNAARKIAARAPSLVQQFRYRTEEISVPAQPGEDGVAPPDATAGVLSPLPASQTLLLAKFDKAALDRLMRAEGLPVWGGQRPRVLLWLGREEQGRRALVVPEADPALPRLLNALAAARGMPLQLPLMDLEDQGALSTADLWAGYAEGIAGASARYPHDAVLSGRLRAVGGGLWAGSWRLREGQEEAVYEASNLDWEAALAAGLDWAQETLAGRYAPFVGGDGPERLSVRFLQVDSLDAYARLQRILQQQDAVTRSSLRETDGGRVDMTLWVRGGRSALARGLMLGGELFEVLPDTGPTVRPTLPKATPTAPVANVGVTGDAPAAEAAGTEVKPGLPPVDLTYRLLHR